MGELSELFQWRGDYSNYENVGGCGGKAALSGWTDDDLDHLQQEIADVAIYCLRLADVCCIDDLGALTMNVSQSKVEN
jgi:dCTP diphosphatase